MRWWERREVTGEDEGRVGRKGRREGRREQVLGGRKRNRERWRVTRRRGRRNLDESEKKEVVSSVYVVVFS